MTRPTRGVNPGRLAMDHIKKAEELLAQADKMVQGGIVPMAVDALAVLASAHIELARYYRPPALPTPSSPPSPPSTGVGYR